MDNSLSRALLGLGVLLAIGMSSAAFIFGAQAKHIGAGRQSIVVKGLAEKPVKADSAQWTVTTTVIGDTFANTLAKLRAQRAQLDQFLAAQGFDKAALTPEDESVEPNMVEEDAGGERTRTVQKGYVGAQSVVVRSADLRRVAAAHKAVLQFKAEGHEVSDKAPLYEVSRLEEIKMSLIGAATQNAQTRAAEFAKVGGVRVGAMRSASQGAFYILPANTSTESSGDYGGAYDKSSVDKIARVVVTIEYMIDN